LVPRLASRQPDDEAAEKADDRPRGSRDGGTDGSASDAADDVVIAPRFWRCDWNWL